MALLDPVGTRQGKYQVDLSGTQGVQVGDGNQQFNSFNVLTPAITMAPKSVEIRPGQPRNEQAFRPAFDAAGGRARLGRALGEVYEDGWLGAALRRREQRSPGGHLWSLRGRRDSCESGTLECPGSVRPGYLCKRNHSR